MPSAEREAPGVPRSGEVPRDTQGSPTVRPQAPTRRKGSRRASEPLRAASVPRHEGNELPGAERPIERPAVLAEAVTHGLGGGQGREDPAGPEPGGVG